MVKVRCGNVLSCALYGIEGVIVDIEVAVLPGLPCFEIVGLGDSAVRESRNRVHAALRNSGYIFPSSRVTASYAPAWLHKNGSAFDLPLALAILIASGQIRRPELPICAFGELSLTGAVRGIPGVICRLGAAVNAGKPVQIFLPSANQPEAAALAAERLYPVSHLNDVINLIDQPDGKIVLPSADMDCIQDSAGSPALDISAISGQAKAVRALQLAAAGKHHLLLLGSPGCGKTTLARIMPGLLPPLDREAALAVTRIHSAAGRLPTCGLIRQRPFRMPHHSVSRATLLGGGHVPVPGEVSLAHQGVLFLDEMTAFRPEVLDALRQPLEEHEVHLYRLHHRFVYPADFLLIGAANPCRCGEYFEPAGSCRCSKEQINRYLGRLSGPLLDRFDLVVDMTRLDCDQLVSSVSRPDENAVNSRNVQKKVAACRQLQQERVHRWQSNDGQSGNLSSRDLARQLEIDNRLVKSAAGQASKLQLSARSFQKILRLARTIADYERIRQVEPEHIAEALQYRLRLETTQS
ncbi:YifB family Mg chelatase-like AAA ATPase [Patescibacteria group bacterium]|nr:YifB family Mg chelatase-like AAA ATPase [Patescibacteria group bacterium]